MKNIEKKECWICHKTLVGKQKLGICPDCFNKGGTPIAGVVILFGLKKAGKLAANLYKIIKG